MKAPVIVPRFVVAAACAVGIAHSAQAQVLSWDFDESGTTAENAGSLGVNYDLNLKASTGAATDLHSADGWGVSGLPGDRALDLTAALAMNGAGPYGQPASETHSDLIFSAMTISGWYQVADGTTMTSGTSIFRNNTTSPRSGWFLRWASSDRLTFGVGNGTSDVTVNSANNAFGNNSGDWMYFALTWDGSSASFYNGGLNASVAAAGSGALSTTMATDAQSIFIGRSSSSGGAFDGLLDDLRVYNSVLDSTAIEAIRVSAVPEPSAMALAGIGALALACFRRRGI